MRLQRRLYRIHAVLIPRDLSIVFFSLSNHKVNHLKIILNTTEQIQPSDRFG